MKYVNQNGVGVDFDPWFRKGLRFTSIHLYEELGGSLAFGTMELLHAGSKEALDLIEKERTGTITLDKKDGGWIYNIPVFITSLSSFRNSVSIEFVCCPLKDFWTVKKQVSWEQDVTETIKSLFPGKVDIRCESDIQAPDLVFYQNKETDLELLTRLCYSFKRDSIFSFGWEGLMIKETMGEKDSTGKTEPNLVLISGGDFQQVSADDYKYNPTLYHLPINVWEDSEKRVALEDYTEKEPRNLRVIKKFGSTYIMRTPYYQLEENFLYNQAYMDSEMTRTITLVNNVTMPKYKIGDVLEYSQAGRLEDGIGWPYKYYLVKSNEFFLAIDGSDLRDEHGNSYCWTSKLLALEENGKIALGSEEDPTDSE